MVVKKSGKLIYGADLTAAEKKAMDIEIRKCMADYTLNNLMEMDAIILYYGYFMSSWVSARKDFANSMIISM